MKNTSTNKNNSGKYYWLSQLAPIDVLTRKNCYQSPKIKDTLHMLRDSTACLFLSELINGKYNFGGVLYNIPPKIYFPEKKKEDLILSSLPDLSNNDLILHTTRPAMDDDEESDKRWLIKSGLELEKIVLQNMEKFFHYCNRQYILLSHDIKYDGDYRAIKFHLKIDAYISCKANVKDLHSLETICKKKKSSKSNKTVGYIVYIPELVNESLKEIGNPGLLSVFSLNGTMTLVWSYLVLTRYSNLIHEMISSKKPRIILAEFSPNISNDIIPNDLSSVVDSVDCEIKVDVTI
jgi:hypothetical protein